jgi:competence protein ComEC
MATVLKSPRPNVDSVAASIPNAEPARTQSARYHPLVILLAAAATGIVVDRYRPLPLLIWYSIAVAALAAWSAVDRRRKQAVASVAILVAVAALAGAWHHDCWNMFSANDIGLFVRSRQEPVCIEAIALETPQPGPRLEPNPLRLARMDDEVRFNIEVTAIRDGGRWRPASGHAAFAVEGPVPNLMAGDSFRAFAHLLPPEHALNPGEADRADLDRGRRITAHLRVTYPEAITVVAGGGGIDARAWLQSLRLRGRDVFARFLQPRQADLAAAVLLGLREQIDPAEMADFQLTGTIHLLVIAGLHLSIIAGLVGFIFSRILPRRYALFATAMFVIAYMLLVDAHPPIVRATVLVVATCVAISMGRYRTGFNVLALAGLIVLALNPTDLFNIGPQLSFLCVAGLMALSPWWLSARNAEASGAGTAQLPRWRVVLSRRLPKWILPEPQPPAIAKLLEQERPRALRGLRIGSRFVLRLALVSGAIWLITMPLVMARFHIFNPISIVLNTLVWVPMAIALGSGLALLFFSIIPGPLATICAAICNWNLWIVERLVRAGAKVPYGHAWVPGPADWWLIGFYAALGLFFAFPRFRPPVRWRWALLGAWIAAGFIVPWATANNRGLRCTFLSVGHGEAIVLELPDGRTVLYDAGRLAAPTACSRSISGYLWSRGLTHIDAVVLSHADTDHYNALPELLERFSVGAVYVSPVMFDTPNAAIRYLSDSIERAKVPLRVIASGDRLSGGPGCMLEVLHPPPHGLPSTSNANSVVISVEYLGRRILLPADLQSPGLDDVLAENPLHSDVLLVPHHGSKSSKPEQLAAWSTPSWAVFSADHRYDTSSVEAIYGRKGHVLHTADTGAVTVCVDEKGLQVETFARH